MISSPSTRNLLVLATFFCGAITACNANNTTPHDTHGAQDMHGVQDMRETHDDSSTLPPDRDAGATPDAGAKPDASMDMPNNQVEDITGATLTSRDPDCTSYAGSYVATATDLNEGSTLMAMLDITAEDSECVFTSNSIPNHDFSDAGSFVTPAAPINKTFRIPRNPTAADMPTPLSLRYDNAIFLNGTKLDLLAAACYGVGGGQLGKEKIGCNQEGQPWRYDPMSPVNGFGTDSHNAHTQPDGAYHYHGDPGVLYDTSGETASAVVGFAADGFPIFGPFIDDGGTIRRVKSGYALKSGDRVSQDGEGAFPGGQHDGAFVDDYEWSQEHGDLDACNGMTRDGTYGYYITDSYPWVIGCFTGTPDESFAKSMGPRP